MSRTSWKVVAGSVLLVACAAGPERLWADSRPTGQPGVERVVEGRGWVVGTWRSYQLGYGDFGEWQGAARIELVAASPGEIELYLISADGKRTPAGDNRGAIWDDKEMIFGPVGSALIFRYRRSGDSLTLDLKTREVRIHARLRRVRDGR